MIFVFLGDKIILLVDRNFLNVEILRKAILLAGIKEELISVQTLEESVAYLKRNTLPSILFIEMTQLLVSSKDKFLELLDHKTSNKPLIVCLILSDSEIEVIEKLELPIDQYLIMPDSYLLDESFIKTLRDMADRVDKGGVI